MAPEGSPIQLARVLHDGLAQELVALGYRVDQLIAAPEHSPAHRAELRELRSEITRLTREIRDEIYDLRDLPQQTLPDFFKSFSSLSEINCEDRGIPERLERPIRDISRELIRNAEKHAGASRIVLSLTIAEDSITLILLDNGRGGAALKDGHYGIQGATEIARSFGGDLTFTYDGGTRACLILPLHGSS